MWVSGRWRVKTYGSVVHALFQILAGKCPCKGAGPHGEALRHHSDEQLPRNSRQNSGPSKQVDQSFLWLGSIPFRFKFSRCCSISIWKDHTSTRCRRKVSPCPN